MFLVLNIDEEGKETGIDISRPFSMKGRDETVIIEYQDTKEVCEFDFYDKEQAMNVFEEVMMICHKADPAAVKFL